jgi:5'-deoxynucleotidase YfbR-like HD superfamily hydrolase
MALVHDLPEAVVGDITPLDGVSANEKHRRESAALAHMADALGRGGAPTRAATLRELYAAYEARAEPAAVLVKDLDRLDMLLQAVEYERAAAAAAAGAGTTAGAPLDLSEFVDGVRGAFVTPEVRAWAEVVLQRRDEARVGRGGRGVAYTGQVTIPPPGDATDAAHGFGRWLPAGARMFAAGACTGALLALAVSARLAGRAAR